MRNDDGTLQAFVADRYPRLRRTAFLMGGDWEVAAEDARAALTKLIADAARHRVDDPDGYAWSELMRTCRRRPGKREHVFVAAADGTGEDPDIILVLDALHRLAPRCRAVLILRRFDDFTVEDTADLLGLSDERVDADEAAALGALEILLAGTLTGALTDVTGEPAEAPR